MATTTSGWGGRIPHFRRQADGGNPAPHAGDDRPDRDAQGSLRRDPDVYVWGNMMLYYVEGDRRKHVSPDVFVVRGVPKRPERDYYLTWKEGKGPRPGRRNHLQVDAARRSKEKVHPLSRRAEGPRIFPVRPDRGLPEAAASGASARGWEIHPDPRDQRPPSHACSACTSSATAWIFASTIPPPAAGCSRGKERKIEAETAQHDAETRAHQAEAENARLRRELPWRRHCSGWPVRGCLSAADRSPT